MVLGVAAILVLCVWLFAELRDASRLLRIFLGVASVVVSVLGAAGMLSFTSQFEHTLETNNVAKNLSSGLLTITSSEYDQQLFRERVRRLDQRIIPTYEDHRSAEVAIRSFLSDYGIDYRKEMPIVEPDISGEVNAKPSNGSNLLDE